MIRLMPYRASVFSSGARGARTLCSWCTELPVYMIAIDAIDLSSKSGTRTNHYALCEPHGRPYMEPALTFLVPSDSGAREYVLHYGPDREAWSCSCESFLYSRSLPLGMDLDADAPIGDVWAALGWCKHLERQRRALLGLPDLDHTGKLCDGCGDAWRSGACSCGSLSISVGGGV